MIGDIVKDSEKREKSVFKDKKIKAKKNRLKQSDVKKYSMGELDHVISKIKANEVKYTIISVLFMLIVLFIIAYMIFSSVLERVNYNILQHRDLLIQFSENENGLGDIIDLVNVNTYSSSNQVLDVYEVSITNSSDVAKKYKVFIEDDLDMIEIDKCQDIFLDRSFLRYSINGGDIRALRDNDSIIFGTLKAKETVTYKIKVWVSDIYSDTPHYHGKFVVKQVD